MILNEFPDLFWLKHQISQGFASRQGWGGRMLPAKGWPTVILNTHTTNVKRDAILGPLSLFTNIRGTSWVTVNRDPVKVTDDYYFLTNSSQYYSLEINQKKEPTETFNIHFGEQFGEEVMASLSNHPEFLLEHPFEKPRMSVNFYNRLLPKDEVINNLIASIRSTPQIETLLEQEKLYQLLVHLIQQQNRLSRMKGTIPALKSSTREEIIKRLFISTDYIYTFFDQNLSLEELAQVSCLSKFHFLRLFKIAFGETPHQFVTKVRVQQAKRLLRSGSLEIREIARQVGFENASSFSRLFYNQIGIYPTQFRV